MAKTLAERAEKFVRHSLYCGWDREAGRYDKTLGCTCGLDEFRKELEGYGQLELIPKEKTDE